MKFNQYITVLKSQLFVILERRQLKNPMVFRYAFESKDVLQIFLPKQFVSMVGKLKHHK